MNGSKFIIFSKSIIKIALLGFIVSGFFKLPNAFAGSLLNTENIKDEQSLDKEVEKAFEEKIKSEGDEDKQKKAIKDLIKEHNEAKSNLDMFGFKFGVGLMGAHFDGKKRVESASIVNGKVQIDKGDNNTLGVIFEAHNLFWNLHGSLYTGPFLGIQTTTNELLDSAVLGWMFGFKYKDIDNGSFNVGIGWVVDPNTKVLSNDFNEGEPLPAGAQNISTKEVTKTGIGVIVSYGF